MATSLSQMLQTGLLVEFVVASGPVGADEFRDGTTPPRALSKPMCGKVVGKHSSDAMTIIVP